MDIQNKENTTNNQINSVLLADDRHFLPLLPLKNTVLLPKSILPVMVTRKSSIQAIEHANKGSKIVFITAQKDPDIEHPTINDIFTYFENKTS